MVQLKEYLTESAYLKLSNLKIGALTIQLSIPRKSKWGDFRASSRKNCIITINKDLNKDTFLFVLLHELAHYFVYKKYIFRRKSHGKEWKKIYGNLLQEFLFYFESKELQKELHKFAKNPIGSVSSLQKIYPLLIQSEKEITTIDSLVAKDKFAYGKKHYEFIEKREKGIIAIELVTQKKVLFKEKTPIERLELKTEKNTNYLYEIPEASEFLFKNRVFIKEKLKRTRYICRCVKTNQRYLIHQNVEIKPYEK